MKQYLLPLLFILFANPVIAQHTKINKVNTFFQSVTTHTDLKKIERYFKERGTLTRIDTSRLGVINHYYDWKLGKGEKALSAWFVADGRLTLFMKYQPLYDFSKCIRLSPEKFESIKRDMTYKQVVSILGVDGDLFRIDFLDDGKKFEYYNWYSCKNKEQYYNIWFVDGKVTLMLD